jgi:hypothetical protein
MEIKIPLIPEVSLKYFNSASAEGIENYYRAIDLRICLERICDTILVNFVSNEKRQQWHSKSFKLHHKLVAAKPFLGNDIVDKLLKVKETGNTGVHQGQEGNIGIETIKESLKIIHDFSLQVFITYFKENGFADNPEGSWIPVVLSTLPPVYRVLILKQYFEVNKSVVTIDKLSMALLKNGNSNEAFSFIGYCFENKYLSEFQYSEFKIKLKMLEANIKNLPIAQNLEDSKEYFRRILTVIPENERDTFIILMSAILIDSSDTTKSL